jgi:DNA-binding MarR family transcriptional regulator
MSRVAAKDVLAIREFNRKYTRAIGISDESLLESGYTLAEGRVLFEISREPGVLAREVGKGLGMDGGYLSRILRRFEVQGLLVRAVAGEDLRSRRLRLTAAGRRVIGELNARADAAVRGMVGGLTREELEELTGAMGVIARLLR